MVPLYSSDKIIKKKEQKILFYLEIIYSYNTTIEKYLTVHKNIDKTK